MDNDANAVEQSSVRDRLAFERTILANERTLLAYVRTALMFAAAGGTLLKFYADDRIAVIGSWILIALGVGVAVFGSWRFRRLIGRLNQGGPP